MYSKLNAQLFIVDKPQKWLNFHFNEMIRTICHYQTKKRFKPKIKAYKSILDNSYILIFGEDLYKCDNISGVCELIFPLYKDIKKYNDNELFKKYRDNMIKREMEKTKIETNSK